MDFKVPLVKPRTTVDCNGLPVYDFSENIVLVTVTVLFVRGAHIYFLYV